MRAIALSLVLCLWAASRAPAQSSAPAGQVHLGGEVQSRYVGAFRGADSLESGFQIRRARLVVTGWFLSRRLTFRVRPSYDRATGNLSFDDAWVAYGRDDGFTVRLGQYKPDVLREEVIPNFSQLAVEVSYASTYFGLDYTQAIQVTWGGHRVRPTLLLHDGSYGANTDFNADRTTVAAAGRLDWLAAGDWTSFAGSSGFSSARTGVLLGAAADVERGQRAASRASPDVLKLTADVSAVTAGASFLVAFYWQRFSMTWASTASLPAVDGHNQQGLVAQAGAFAVKDRVELFGRFEWMDFSGVYYRNSAGSVQAGSRNLGTNLLRIWTGGVNCYLRGQAAKLSLDLQYAQDPVPVDNTGVGLLRYDAAHELAVRTQFQWRF